MKAILKKIKEEKGLSLPEIIITMVIMSLLAGAFISSFVFSAKVNSQAYNITNATYIAQKHIEDLYELSNTSFFDDSLVKLTGSSFGFNLTQQPSANPTKYILNKKDEDGFNITITIDRKAYANKSDKVVVQVDRDTAFGPNNVHIETVLVWLDDIS